jgi:hypothetical protein
MIAHPPTPLKLPQAWLHGQSDFTLMNWPPTSPNPSRIENARGIVAKQMQARTDLAAKDFENVVFEEWEKLQQSTMQALYTSTQRIVKARLAEKGMGAIFHSLQNVDGCYVAEWGVSQKHLSEKCSSPFHCIMPSRTLRSDD